MRQIWLFGERGEQLQNNLVDYAQQVSKNAFPQCWGKVPGRADEGRSFMGIGVARKLRQTSTIPEVKLWQYLRDRRFMGLKYRVLRFWNTDVFGQFDVLLEQIRQYIEI